MHLWVRQVKKRLIRRLLFVAAVLGWECKELEVKHLHDVEARGLIGCNVEWLTRDIYHISLVRNFHVWGRSWYICIAFVASPTVCGSYCFWSHVLRYWAWICLLTGKFNWPRISVFVPRIAYQNAHPYMRHRSRYFNTARIIRKFNLDVNVYSFANELDVFPGNVHQEFEITCGIVQQWKDSGNRLKAYLRLEIFFSIYNGTTQPYFRGSTLLLEVYYCHNRQTFYRFPWFVYHLEDHYEVQFTWA